MDYARKSAQKLKEPPYIFVSGLDTYKGRGTILYDSKAEEDWHDMEGSNAGCKHRLSQPRVKCSVLMKIQWFAIYVLENFSELSRRRTQVSNLVQAPLRTA